MGSFLANVLGLPTLVVGPKVSQSPWLRAAAHFSDTFSFCNYELLRTGNTNFGQWTKFKPGKEYFVCEICQLRTDAAPHCPYHPKGIHCVTRKRTAPTYRDFRFHPAVKFIIFDEAHRMGGLDSLNAELGIAARQQGIKTLWLSATLAQSPLQLRALGYALDLHADKRSYEILRSGNLIEVPSFYDWVHQYGCRSDMRFGGLHWFASDEQKRRIMRELRQLIFSRGIRIRSEDIPGFPKRVILPELYDVEGAAECYDRMRAALEQLNTSTLSDKNPEHPLTKILRERQRVELLKVPIVADLAEDDKAKGFSRVFFVNFRQTIDELLKLFPNAGVIDGTTNKSRDATLARFQENTIDELIVNNEAGGVALSAHDLDGEHPRMGYFFPNFSATTADQVFGRLQRDGGKSTCYYRVIFADNTIEKKVHSTLCSKLGAMGALMDGTLDDNDFRPVELAKLKSCK